jgi:hypothetical protein
MDARDIGCTQLTAAAKAGFCERTGRRIDSGTHQPKQGQPRDWRTRADPLVEVWNSELEPMLKQQPKLEAMTLFEHLQEQHPGQYQTVLRTLQRRVSEWKALNGLPKELMFELRHNPGELGLSDFTQLKGVTITIAGMPYEHLLYHYRLAYSGWQYVQIIEGGESFIALAEGLQNALAACGGVPKQHRTDSLSAAYANSGGKHRLTERYGALCRHYQMQSSRNNTGVAHENGAIESPHGYFKRRLVQQLYLRGSFDFDNVAEYGAFITTVVAKLNAKCSLKYAIELALLQPLPRYRCADYDLLSVRVSCRATVDIKSVLYTVPERLIGRALTVHLYHNRAIGYLGTQAVVELPRVLSPSSHAGRRVRAVNYRHLVQGLRRKPRALLYCTWQQEILPNAEYRSIWQQMLERYDCDSAARMMVEALYIAATQDKELAVCEYLQQQLAEGSLTIGALQRQFQLLSRQAAPAIAVTQHSLASYDQLLHYEPTHQPNPSSPDDSHATESLREPNHPSQKPEALPHAQPLAAPGTTGDPGALELCPVPVSTLRTRSHKTLPGQDSAGNQRVAATSGQGAQQLPVCSLPQPQPGISHGSSPGYELDRAGRQLFNIWAFWSRQDASGIWHCPFHGGVRQTGQVLLCHRAGADPSASQTQSESAGDVEQARPLRSAAGG